MFRKLREWFTKPAQVEESKPAPTMPPRNDPPPKQTPRNLKKLYPRELKLVRIQMPLRGASPQERYDAYSNCKTVGDAYDLGVRPADIDYDVNLGYIKVLR